MAPSYPAPVPKKCHLVLDQRHGIAGDHFQTNGGGGYLCVPQTVTNLIVFSNVFLELSSMFCKEVQTT